MDTNYRIAYNKGWRDLKSKTPAEIAASMDVEYVSSKQWFIVPFLNENYIVDCGSETIGKEPDGSVPPIGAAILILHYLSYFQSKEEIANKWVSLKEIPNGGILFYPAFHKEAIGGLIKAFGQQPELLLKCAASLGGKPAAFGDVSATFQVFPKIPLCIVIWEGDEEIPANATILFDPSIQHFLHIESIIGLGCQAADKLVQLALKQ
ncbi:MAG TPA: DUF3786 domain-containing protein [Methylomusa anaerophila]|uniref:DUF3786 domain-containing protein n=1 Tax=Methylomusa anaerophila TaxID=1930071 RepID=A0A348ALN3_9FIRM|nr:DUF3786 domain-containing protein [Methylomusa anaerophila]BBB91981.1 hypothetical protein MAMMFC1_02666 [Methylomusa anaerophila]HML88006.1 DUF3786 domain-containing protein [Methylomusa anaerophila]